MSRPLNLNLSLNHHNNLDRRHRLRVRVYSRRRLFIRVVEIKDVRMVDLFLRNSKYLLSHSGRLIRERTVAAFRSLGDPHRVVM